MINSSKPSPAEIHPKVAHDNFAQLFKVMAQKRAAAGMGEKGIILPSSYEFSKKTHVQPLFPPTQFYGGKTFPSCLPVKTMPPFKRRSSSAYSAKHDEPAEKVKRFAFSGFI